jgi:serine/threonine-protein kinase
VLPFVEISAEKHLDYFCEGIAEEIISALTALPAVRVVARTSAFRFLSSLEDVRQVGSTLGVGWVLEGSVRASGDRLRVIARLVDTADGSQRWSQRFDCLLDDVFAVQEQIATAAARALGVRASGTVIPHGDEQPTFDAYTLYLRGRHCWNQRTEATLQRSVKYFSAAIESSPGYGEALAGLAEAYATLGLYGVLMPHDIMPKAKDAAERAIEKAPGLSSPHATAGCVAAVYDWAWTQAEEHFNRAFSLNPRDPVAHHWYAINYLVPLGRFDLARSELARAAEADPLSMPIRMSVGLTSYFAHDFERARHELEESLELDPGASTAYLFLGLALTELEQHDEALREIETAQRLSPSPEMTAAVAYVCARTGREEQARRLLQQLQSLSTERYISPSLSAQVFVALHDVPAALAELERAQAAHAADLVWLRVRPVFDPLQGEPVFRNMLERLNLLR